MIIKAKSKKRLGDILVSNDLITEEQLKEALEAQKGKDKLLGDVIVELGFLTSEEITEALRTQLNLESVKLGEITIPDTVLRLDTDVNFFKRNVCIPFEIDGNNLKVAVSDPLNTISLDDLSVKTGLRAVPYIASKNEIFTAIDKYFGSEAMQELIKSFNKSDFAVVTNDEETDTDDEDAPMIKLVNAIFEQAVHMKASDIHIEPMENRVRVRYRVDGDLVEQKDSYSTAFLGGIVSRLKIMAGMDISEKRKPQDGRITIYVDNVEFDVRVSMLPTSFGEKTVMRLTNKSRLTMEKKNLGLLPEDEVKFDSLLENSHGIILVTGPTGSGKSTTLYTALSELNVEKVNICTVEDPVEANLDGLNQVQVNPKAGLTFPSALRSFLRQDPDIIMVGEIRDTETANLAVDAALTGHLVVSTLHTNSSVSTISRLEKMGIEPYLVADSVEGILAQRLVKRLCDCKKPHILTKRERKKLDLKEDEEFTCYEPCGCVKCNGTGYRGRIAIYEILILTDELKDMIADEVPIGDIEKKALEQGLNTLKISCKKQIANGVTSIEEMDRIVHEPKLDLDMEG